MDAAHLAPSLDFIGGMVYMEPPGAARGPLSVAGDVPFVCLLWAPDTSPETMEREAREAVHAGCPATGYWIRGEDGGYRMDPERSDAMRRAFGSVESEWLAYYSDNVLTGDGRLALVEGALTAQEPTITVRNTGQLVHDRGAERIHLTCFR
jgi:hypothetical protein